MQRRDFLKYAAVSLGAAMVATSPLVMAAGTKTLRSPRWYGFNLTELFSGVRPADFQENDFAMMAEWGFNFARIPMSYWNWSRPDNWLVIDEKVFSIVDEVIHFGKQYGIHICLNLHRIPGYCVNGREKEPKDLFAGPEADQVNALQAATTHWQFITQRYKGISSQQLSFDLINEPATNIPKEKYVQVVQHLVQAIRAIDAERLIIADGWSYGTTPVAELIPLQLMQSGRGYAPMQLTHYKASWVTGMKELTPAWPLRVDEQNTWDKTRLKQHFQPWKEIEHKGVAIHIGEWGVYNQTPHPVTLAFMKDQLRVWKKNHWGWALWNLRGAFGILNSGRKDVSYENYKGQQLDRLMLELLMQYRHT